MIPFAAAAAAVSSSGHPTPVVTSFTFDEQRILSAETTEKKELFLFQWLSSLEKDLLKATKVNI